MIDAIKELDTRQKVTLVITIALFVFIIFYGYETFFSDGGGSSSSPPPVARTEQPAPPPEPTAAPRAPSPEQNPNQQPPIRNNMPPNGAANDASGAAPGVAPAQGWQGNAVQPAAAAPTMIVQPPSQPSPEQLALLKESQETQQEYLKLVNEYQLAQLKQKLEQANADIAQAKLRSAQTLAQIQLLADKLKEQTAPPSLTAVTTPEAQPAVSYQLAYVGKQSGKWIAMLNSNGAYFEVNEGTRLSDGAVVKEINEKGMILSRNGKKEYLTISKGLD